MTVAQIRYDPFDATILNDPYPTYRLLRDTAPVYRAEESHTWVLSRHADVQAAALDHRTYSSVDGIFPTPPGSDFIGSFLPMMIVMVVVASSATVVAPGRAARTVRAASADAASCRISDVA